MSASKSTYLQGVSAFPCTFSLSRGHFPDHMGPILGQKPDTYCRIFKKLFFILSIKKTGMLSCTPAIRRIFLLYLASAGLNVILTAFTGCVPAALGGRFLSFPSPRNNGGCPCLWRMSSHRSTESCSDWNRNWR